MGLTDSIPEGEQVAMTTAHTALLAQLHDELGKQADIVIRSADTPANELGNVDFGRRVVTIARDASFPEFVCTLMHMLRRLSRGPCYVDDEEAEERAAVDEAVRLLVPPSHLLMASKGASPQWIADDLGVDLDTVEHALRLAQGGGRGRGPEAP